MEAIFVYIQNGLIFRIFDLFKAVFAYNNCNVIIESFLVCFVQFYFLTQTDDFAKAIAHG